MSSSEYFIFDKDGKIVDEIEMRNGHGSMPAALDYLCMKYLEPVSANTYGDHVSVRYAEYEDFMAIGALFAARNEEGWMTPEDIFLLDFIARSDRCLVKGEDFQWFANLLRFGLGGCGSRGTGKGRVNHWTKVSEWLGVQPTEGTYFGYYATSVSENPWVHRKPEPDEDATDEEWAKYDEESQAPVKPTDESVLILERPIPRLRVAEGED